MILIYHPGGNGLAQMTAGHVFISYCRKDEAVMQRIVAYLREQGISVWVDNEKLIPGTATWKKAIERAIKEASVIFVLLSPASYNSIWVEREISFAESHEKTIFPILVDGNEKNAIPITLVNHQRIDIRQNESIGLNFLNSAHSMYLEIATDQEKKPIEKAEVLTSENAKHEFDGQKKNTVTPEQSARPASFPEEIKTPQSTSLHKEIKSVGKPKDLPR